MAVEIEPFGPHPVTACAERISGELDAIAHVPVELMAADDKAAALVAVSAMSDRLEALRLRLLAASDDVARDVGARDAGAWLAHESRRDRREQQRNLRLATALAQRWQRLGARLADGSVNLAQARVITYALDHLPDDVPAEVVARAEAQLVDYAGSFGPADLRVLGRRILDVVAPEVGEAAEARALEAEERRAAERTVLTLTPCGDGTTRLHGRLPDAAAHRLATYLDAFTSPRRVSASSTSGAAGSTSGAAGSTSGAAGSTSGAAGSTSGAAGSTSGAAGPTNDEPRGPVERRRGQAFCALLEHLDPAKLPAHGGDATTVMVTMTLDQLRSELATAGVIGVSAGSAAERISAGELRRLACNAEIIPVVLGGKSEILDLGRTSRLFSRAQRKAMRIRDRHCRAKGCTMPASWCEVHHLKSWALGGATDLADGVLLCPFHHHRAHDPTYEMTRHPGGELEFRRRGTH